MDMKLDSNQIKFLRLHRSWSQEDLAAKTGLNVRTIQRVETEGTGSLRTRKAIALALEVEPSLLDASPDDSASVSSNGISSKNFLTGALQNFKDYLLARNSYHFILLILLTVFYVAAHPFYFSMSRVSFSWINFSIGFGKPLVFQPLWWVSTLIFWALLIVPWLMFVRNKYPKYFITHLMTMLSLVILSVARLFQPALVMESVTVTLYYSTLLLLAFQYLENKQEELVRQAVALILISYIYLWFFQSLSHLLLLTSHTYFYFDRNLFDSSFVVGFFLKSLSNLVQLLPVAMVLLFSKGNKYSGLTDNMQRGHKNHIQRTPKQNNNYFSSLADLLKSYSVSKSL